MKFLTEEQAIELLRQRQGLWNQKIYAVHLGVSAAFLSDVYNRRRDLGPKLMKALGLVRGYGKAK